MGTKRRIQKTIGYPTTDGESFNSFNDAINHQTDIDLNKSCDDDGNINSDDLKKYLSKNVDVVQDYIKYHLTEKPAAKEVKKKTAKPKAAKPKVDDKSSES